MPAKARVVVPFSPTLDRAKRRAVCKSVNGAIHQLQLADESVHDQEVVRARGHFQAARDAIDEALRLLKG